MYICLLTYGLNQSCIDALMYFEEINTYNTIDTLL